VWLFISAFAWTHTYVNRTNTWIVAILMFAVSIWTMVTPVVRYANAVLAAWLFVSALAMFATAATVWNNVLVAVGVFILAFLPPASESQTRPPRSSHTPVNL